MSYTLAPLPYAYNSLEPIIDEQTMRLHHDKHHQTYVDNLNKAIADVAECQNKSIEDLMSDLNKVPEKIRNAVRNNGGGHVNHQLFWKLMTPGGAKAPAGALDAEIKTVFGSLDALKEKFVDAGLKQFGSGWCFLCTDAHGGNLEIVTLPNQDTVISQGKTVIMANDLWEHAYYLTYNNRRADYLKAWFDILNWSLVGERFDACRAGDTKKLAA